MPRSLTLGFVLACLLFSGCVSQTPVEPEHRNELIGIQRVDGGVALLAGEPGLFWLGERVTDAESAYPWEVHWDFGDGQTAVGNPVEHTYAVEGRYTINATFDGGRGSRGTFVDLHVERFDEAPLRHPVTGPNDAANALTYEVRAGNLGTSVQIGLSVEPDALHEVFARIEAPDGTVHGPQSLGTEPWMWAPESDAAPVGDYTVTYWTEGPAEPQNVFVEARVFF